MKRVFGLIMYGIPNPYSRDSSSAVLYTDGELPTAGRPSELSTATVLEIVDPDKLPGIQFGADPRNPVGQGGEISVFLREEENDGTLGTMFQKDVAAGTWGLNTNRLTAADTVATVNDATTGGSAAPASGLYFIENECVDVEVTSQTLSTTPTYTLALTRGQCGSIARVHVLRPADYSAGEDGSADRIELSRKPNFDERFLCGVYCFVLDQNNAIWGYVLRRGVVLGEPTYVDGHAYEIAIQMLEDTIADHEVGNGVELSLSYRMIITQTGAGPAANLLLPQQAIVLCTAPQADRFFGDPSRLRNAEVLDADTVSDLSTRIQGDPQTNYQLVVDHDDTWVFHVDALGVYSFQANGQSLTAVAIYLTLEEDGFSEGATVLSGDFEQASQKLKPWWRMSTASIFVDGDKSGAPPRMRLRMQIRATVADTFLKLMISNDGSSGLDYDDLIGGIGMGLPQSYFNTGSLADHPMDVLGNTKELFQLNQLLGPINVYTFDLGRPINLRTFLTNEFIASQLLLGPLQNGRLALTSWFHQETPTVTLEPVNRPQKVGKRLSSIKRLDLAAGLRILDLEPATRRSVRWMGTQNIKTSEVQPLRFHREGLNLSEAEILEGDLSGLVLAFYKVFGGAPTVYPVTCHLEDHIRNGVNFGDSVLWSDSTLPSPNGMGISGAWFVVGIDPNYDDGEVTYLLLQNRTVLLLDPGLIGPVLRPFNVTHVSNTIATMNVLPSGQSSFNPETDFGETFIEIYNNSGYVELTNFDQAPIGPLEPVGSVTAHAKITAITTNPDGSVTFQMTVPSAYLRGSITRAADLFIEGETRIVLPSRVPANTSLSGVLIEAEVKASPAQRNFLSYQPKAPLNGRLHTFGTGG